MSEDQTGRQQAQEGEWLLPSDVARILNVTIKTVGRYARAGKIRYKLTLGGHRRYLRADVLAADAEAQQGRSSA